MSSRGAEDGVWQDREVRFDSLPGQLRCRKGEVTIDSINSVEDTKGNNGEKGLEHEARQQRLFTEAGDVEPDTKTRKRTKGASGTDQVIDVDSLSPRVEYGPTSLTSFSMIDGPPAPEKSVGDVLVDKGAEAPKPCISPAEIRTTTATGSLLPAGTASSAMMITFPPLPIWNFCPFEDMNFRTTTSIQIYATHGSFRQMKP